MTNPVELLLNFSGAIIMCIPIDLIDMCLRITNLMRYMSLSKCCVIKIMMIILPSLCALFIHE